MKVLIIEDETTASENLVEMLKEIDSSIEVLHVLESVQQTVRWLNTNPAPDLIFMDIHLSDGSAFTLFDQIDIQTPIVFTTAYDQYALDAFTVNSIDYLLKPIKTVELTRALDKFKRWSKSDVVAYLEQMMKLRPSEKASGDYKQTLLIPSKDKLLPVNTEDVACIYSTDRKTQVYLKNKSVLDYNRSLDSIIGSLDPAHFFRANKQYIVARDCILEIVIWFDSRLLLRLPIELPEPLFVSKNRAAEFKNWMTRPQNSTFRN
jgi:DNA-binding LytR/AlgR family response regulator